MSTTSESTSANSSDSNLKTMSLSVSSLDYVITHVFLPVFLPMASDYTLENELALARVVCDVAHDYSAHLYGATEPQWHRITKMLDNLAASIQSEHLVRGHVISQLRGMQTGDIVTLYSRPQNAVIILTKQENRTLFESFEVSPKEDSVVATEGSLRCSYPWSAVEIPNEVFDDEDFQLELANFLSHQNAVDSNLPSPPPGCPQYITALLTGILRSVGRTAEVPHITKRVRDEAKWQYDTWRRSPLWLLIRVAIQMSFDRSPLGRTSYKAFMLFFMHTLARNANNANLSSDLLHLMSSRILRRLTKLGSFTPDRLSKMALDTCARLREILDARWKPLTVRPSPFRNPSQIELSRDTQLSLLNSREYICDALANHGNEPHITSFRPCHRPRGTLDDFLSSNGTFFQEAYEADPEVTLYDVEQSVQQGIDDWVACVTDVEDACAQLEILMDKYMVNAKLLNPEDTSRVLLTGIELFVALDKLVVKEIPMLADYPPGIPIPLLERLLLCNTASLHRLSCAYQYLSMRLSQSRPGWSVFSNEFTEDSFPVRYYDQSPCLQQLKARIEKDAGCVALRGEASRLVQTYDESHGDEQHLLGRRLADGAEVSQSPLPTSLLHTKVVVFELQCPMCIRFWHSAAARIPHYACYDLYSPCDSLGKDHLLAHYPALQSYCVEGPRKGPPPSVQIELAYFYPEDSQPRSSLQLCYTIQYPSGIDMDRLYLSTWRYLKDPNDWLRLSLPPAHDIRELVKYVNSTSHTSNDMLATQVGCPADFSLDEFIAFAHLRSGGSLQWINILRGLRSKTLNFRRQQVHFLLTQATLQVGPLDLNTGEWIWHRELQDPSFCNALLDELASLLVDVGAGLVDGVTMNAISLLLTRILGSSPSECVSERAIALLWSVRRKTFRWILELSHDLSKAPTNKERRVLLQDMAATCRSTFDVDSTTLPGLFHSAEDIDALLSSAIFIYAIFSWDNGSNYSSLLLERDCHLSLTLEMALRDAILADPSDYSIDLAVSKLFVTHKPSTHRWEQLQHTNCRWIRCKTEATGTQSSQLVYLDLLSGALRVDGKLLGGLRRVIGRFPECREIFRDQGFFAIPSNLPGMDFTFATTSKYQVHFSLGGDDVVVQAQCNETKNTLELIPSRILREDLPPALVDGHVHWLNRSTKTIEIRPRERIWEQSSDNWRIGCISGQYRASRDRETLVCIESPTGHMLSKCFGSLNIGIDSNGRYDDLLITISPIDSSQSEPVLQLSVALPHYGLSFFINDCGELESHDFKDMVHDENQSVGALFGLENLLVLRQKTKIAEELMPRRILIPNAHRIEKRGDHLVQFTLLEPWAGEPLYHTYNVDTELGCLTRNSSMASMRHLAYLHAITSCHRPDPLTGKTGIQAGVCLLQSACFSSINASDDLGLDGCYAWSFNQVTAYLGWKPNHYWICNILYDTSVGRAAQRARYLFPSKVTGLTSTQNEDVDYAMQESELELREVVFSAASAIYRWSINSPTMNTISDWAELWSNHTLSDAASLAGSLHDSQNPRDLVRTLMVKVHDILEKKERSHWRFQLLFLLPTIAYCSPHHQLAFLSMLITFARRSEAPLGNPPVYAGCKISDGYRPTEWIIRDHISRSCPPHLDNGCVNATVMQLLKNWPSNTPPTDSLDCRLGDVERLKASLQPLFSSCYRNFSLKEHLTRILSDPGQPTLSPMVLPLQFINESTSWKITLEQLISSRPAPELPLRSHLLCDSQKVHKRSTISMPALDQLFASLRTVHAFQQQYITHLDFSTQCLREECQTTHRVVGDDVIMALEKHYAKCRVNYFDALGILKSSLGPTADLCEQIFDQFGLWPPITGECLLRCLASTSAINIPPSWKKCLTSLALLLLDIQHARRLLRFAIDGLKEEFSKELENEGCDGWNPEEYPDWLLIQIQGNFLIRRTQAETAMEMISPQSGESTILQVNMGEGKSSVIIPIAAAALANGKQLVRVVVPKALTYQMFESLVSRLGWLTNRQILHLPTSRSPQDNFVAKMLLDEQPLDFSYKIISGFMAKRGILLVQPEHVASLRLMSIEERIQKGKLAADLSPGHQQLIHKHIMRVSSIKSLSDDSFVGNMFRFLGRSPNQSSKRNIAQADRHDDHTEDVHGTSDGTTKWPSIPTWIQSHARDILDESDEILHSRFQLIYTIGLQQHMDGYPDRWTITQQVLRLVKECARSLSRDHPNSIRYERGPPGSFPHVRIVKDSDGSQRLILLIVEDIMTGRLPNFNFQNISPELYNAIRRFISDADASQSPETVAMVEEHAKNSNQSHLWSGLLLLRGLLVSNILFHALTERRWRVDYGLFPQEAPSTSTMLAVPYRAKDLPVPNTQFGHPDITIVLTCLSYYYTGLNEEQLRLSFETLLDEDDPSSEYAHWVEEYDDCELAPDSLQRLDEINPRSSEQWNNVTFPLFARNHAAIDFYLSRVVFPKEAKEYPWKLSVSSWDLAEKRENIITGFSGTNDGRWLLPISITQRDLAHQQGTNARVLTYLLQPENDYYMAIQDSESGKRRSTPELLQMVATQRPEIRVLLDVGAQILDLSNREAAKAWLDIVGSAAGAIFFDEKGELTVLTRNGVAQPMLSSPLSQRLDRCVVYLDHAHTRGTDIKLPLGSRAAVTLGQKVTKDSLVQGCMRMRKLGHGHSVMFFAPPEVDRNIRAVSAKLDPKSPVTSAEVLCWAIHETWNDIQQRAPYWAQQGMRYRSRYEAWSRFCNNDLTPEQLSEVWLEPEFKSLEDAYAPPETGNTSTSLSQLDPDIRQRCKDMGIFSLPTARTLDEEQEREVNREQEREREVELPPYAESAEHFLHPDVVTFVRTGIIPLLHSGSPFRPVFTTLERSSASTCEADVWSPFILATVDFCNTIKPESTPGTFDQYLRPVQWVLSSKRDLSRVLVLLSPFEADRLLPDIRASDHVHLHLYVPRTSQRMKPSDDLKLYTIPPLPSDWTPPWDLIDQLNVFAGQLYLRDYASYLRLCRFLGIPTNASTETTIRRNLFNIPGSFEGNEVTFSYSPLPSVMALLAIRNRGRPFAHTHMGKILQGQILTEKDFEVVPSVKSGDSSTTLDSQTPQDIISKTISPLPSNMGCDSPIDPGPSMPVRSSKRG